MDEEELDRDEYPVLTDELIDWYRRARRRFLAASLLITTFTDEWRTGHVGEDQAVTEARIIAGLQNVSTWLSKCRSAVLQIDDNLLRLILFDDKYERISSHVARLDLITHQLAAFKTLCDEDLLQGARTTIDPGIPIYDNYNSSKPVELVASIAESLKLLELQLLTFQDQLKAVFDCW